ncbi:hypothetical protein GE061_018856 [Apolygus lucorum]|uniref:Uncharacterized protein n=1 Tax=Apolygus lucorum TaxID=248454 RepID=A0A8S9XAX0_APOLU|nr:hypothetical protein GE061_018856 [Apolygus lucorum]
MKVLLLLFSLIAMTFANNDASWYNIPSIMKNNDAYWYTKNAKKCNVPIPECNAGYSVQCNILTGTWACLN